MFMNSVIILNMIAQNIVLKSEWLNIKPQPEKKLQEIVELGLDAYAFNGLDYSFNS